MKKFNDIYILTQIILLTLILCCFSSSSSATTDEVLQTTWSKWPNTVYYLAHLSGPDGPYEDITVYITAVDEYTLYVNGQEIGSDNDWETVDKWTVNVSRSGVAIAVKVTNYGTGNGNGLMVDIKANADWMGTSTMSRRTHIVKETRILFGVAWYYYAGDVTAKLGDDWYDQDINFFYDGQITQKGFKQVMLGQMGDIGYTPDPHIEIVTGYPGDIDIGSSEGGGIRLRRVEGENLALGKPAQEEKLTDGDLVNGFAFSQDPVGITKYIDLEEIRRINKMILFTGGTNPNNWVRDSVRGYSVEISQDQFRYEEVGVLHEIGIHNADEGDYDWYAIRFPDEWARYLRFKITESRISHPNIGEVMIYGVGHVYNGVYESDWYDFDAPNSMKNFDKVSWSGHLEPGTRIVIQTKTMYDNNGTLVESDWSTEHSDTTFAFDSPEPATVFKYRVKLFTQDIDFSPEFRDILITWSEMPPTSINEINQPSKTKLIGNSPNPFNPDTTIRFFLGADHNGLPVELSVFNCNGQLIRTLVNNSLNPGMHSFVWDGSDNSGDKVSSGIYVSRLTTGSRVFTNKMLLMK